MKRFDMEIQPTPHYMGEGESYDVSPYESTNGDWVKWDDFKDAIALLKEARYLCAYPDMNTSLLGEIDAFLIKVGETELPELY